MWESSWSWLHLCCRFLKRNILKWTWKQRVDEVQRMKNKKKHQRCRARLSSFSYSIITDRQMFHRLLEKDAGEWNIKVMHHQNVLAVRFEMQPRSHRSGYLTRTKNDKRLQSSMSLTVPTRSSAKSHKWTENPSGGIKEIKIKSCLLNIFMFCSLYHLWRRDPHLRGSQRWSSSISSSGDKQYFKENTFIC